MSSLYPSLKSGPYTNRCKACLNMVFNTDRCIVSPQLYIDRCIVPLPYPSFQHRNRCIPLIGVMYFYSMGSSLKDALYLFACLGSTFICTWYFLHNLCFTRVGAKSPSLSYTPVGAFNQLGLQTDKCIIYLLRICIDSTRDWCSMIAR